MLFCKHIICLGIPLESEDTILDTYRSYGRGNMYRVGHQQCSSPVNCVKKPVKCERMDDCGDNNKHMSHMQLGMGYVPMQAWGELYDPCKALKEGTAFPCLNLIFCGSRGKM